MIPQKPRFSAATHRVWQYLSDLWARHWVNPRWGVRPRVETIATACGCTRRTVFRALATLTRAGHLTRRARARANGEQTSSWYVVHKLRRNVDNSVDNSVDNQRRPRPAPKPRAPRRPRPHPDVTPLETPPCPVLPHHVITTATATAALPPMSLSLLSLPWTDELQHAYERYIAHPLRPDPRRLATAWRRAGLARTIAPALPPATDPEDVLRHLTERLADAAERPERKVRQPARWVAGYLRRLVAQGGIRRQHGGRSSHETRRNP